MILMSAPRAPARIAAPGLDSMLSTSPASRALCASAPFFIGTISSLRPCPDAKSRSPTMSMKPASPFGSITTCFHGFSSAADAEAPSTAMAKATKYRAIIVDPPIFLLNHDHRPNG
jgi:hypothetical protein